GGIKQIRTLQIRLAGEPRKLLGLVDAHRLTNPEKCSSKSYSFQGRHHAALDAAMACRDSGFWCEQI
ncbi:MAG: hypothetical protein LW695_09875, partial [Phenylobacterium sp.]|nr:hypothetical protein [Phenylobacterium sp.]